ncbi:phage tail sheath subtilisin-like domain-containing protein [Photobacterium sp. WH24]|uniref:phage tail sheath subtilisin-like domain-containing protein n=1 Tax=Photobacterium sp. WH24 TaxID=2827237 RepID=UPI001C481D57|nr:phage tail sheath subtilisin-like domain-containing protein [Photobacterium sp. WH24]MBV7262562.1 phage tail sheath subtilisin-like domain-containing protein [Photobacterium sp. WH24]
MAIPNDIRVPLFYMEFDNSNANKGIATQQHKILAFGQMTTGTATALEQYRITNDDQAKALFGADSMLAAMVLKLRQSNNYTELWAMPVAEPTGGAAATATLTVTGSAAQAGTLALMVAGQRVHVGVSQGDAAAAVATSIASAINAVATMPVSASANAGTVTLTAKWKGLTGNDIDVRLNYYDTDQTPAGLAVVCNTLSGGAGTIDPTVVIGAMGDEWFNHLVCPYNDQAFLDGLRIELNDRWGPLRMMEAICYTAYRGNHAATGTWGGNRNDHLITCMGTNLAPNPTWEWAAAYAAQGAYHLAIDPARPLQTLPLVGIVPPAKRDRWDMVERNLLLWDGVATYNVDAGNQVLIEREISTYQTNAFGSPDPSYLDITTPATLGYFRFVHKAHFTQKYPRHKLADDSVLENLEPGQPVITPKIARVDMLDLFLQLQQKGLVENFEQYAAELEVFRDSSNANRLNVVCSPDLINGLRVMAHQVQFYL